MGVQIGYSYYCKKCNRLLKDISFFEKRLNPMNFGDIVQYCPNCNERNIVPHDEFFTVTKKDFNQKLYTSICTWLFLILVLLLGILSFIENKLFLLTIPIFIIIFIPLYYISFKNRWNKNIEISKKRLNNEEYLYNLLLFDILNFKQIIKFKNENIISQNTIDNLIYNINNYSSYDINELKEKEKLKKIVYNYKEISQSK